MFQDTQMYNTLVGIPTFTDVYICGYSNKLYSDCGYLTYTNVYICGYSTLFVGIQHSQLYTFVGIQHS